MKKKIITEINRIKKQVNFNSFIGVYPKNYISLQWMQLGLRDDLGHINWKINSEENVEFVLKHNLQGVIDWYSTDVYHPLQPLPKQIKDAYWGCFKTLFEAAGLPFNYNDQLQQFYNDDEVPEPNIDAVEFPKPDAPIQANAGTSKKASLLLEKKVFNLEPYTTDLKRLEKQVKVFCSNVLGYYEDGKLSQSKFDVLLSKFFEKIEDVYQSLDSEDRESLPNYLTRFAAVLGLSQNII
jgi:hypothetical protein